MDLETIKASIKELNELDLNGEYSYEQTIWKYLTCVEIPSFVLTIPKDTIVFRTRTHTNSEPFFRKVSEIGVTPKKYVSGFGRCNRPNQSVFYASENRMTSYAELIESWSETHNSGDIVTVTIGSWRLKKDMDVVIITSPDKDKKVSEYDVKHGKTLDLYLDSLDKEDREGCKEFYRFLFDIYRKPSKGSQNNYILTSAITNILLMHPEANTDGIYYPSVPYSSQGVNFAISENFCQSHMELNHAVINQFEVSINPSNGKHNFKEIDLVEAKKIDINADLVEW